MLKKILKNIKLPEKFNSNFIRMPKKIKALLIGVAVIIVVVALVFGSDIDIDKVKEVIGLLNE